jgi:hypothetical protein
VVTSVASSATFDGAEALVLKVGYVGSERRFLAATRAALFEVNAAGVQRRLYTFDFINGAARFPGVAAVGNYVYFTDDKRDKSGVPVDSVVVRRIDLTSPVIAPEVVTSLTGGDLRLDPHGETFASAFQFQHPRGVAPAFDGGLYVADDRRHAVYHLAPDASGQVGPNSVVTRILGSGVDTMVLGLGQTAPGLMMAVRAPGELAVAADGTLFVTTADWSTAYASITTYDPISDTARTMVLDKTTRLKQIELAVQGFSLAPLRGDTALVSYASSAYRVATPLSSQFAPTRIVTFDDQGASVTDTNAGTVEAYQWLNPAHTECRLIALRHR